MRRFGRRFLLLALVLGPIPAVGCTSAAPTAEKAAPGPTGVTVALPQKRAIRWRVEQPGTIQAYETAPIIAKVPGYVGRVLVDMGSAVKGPLISPSGVEVQPGTLLAELTIPELDEERGQKEAMVAQANAEVEVARQNLDVAGANVKSSETYVAEMEATLGRTEANRKRWKSESARSEEMVARRVMDRQTADETRNQATAAESECEESKARIASARAKLAESRAKERQARSEIAAAQARSTAAAAEVRRIAALKSYARITAPFDGVVTARNVHTGHFLQMNSMQPLFVIARLEPVRVFMDVPETAAAHIRQDANGHNGSPAIVKIPSLRGDITGTVTRSSWALNPDIRTLRVEIELPNKDGRIRPGSFCTVVLPIEDGEAMTVETSAIVTADDVTYCYTAEGGKAVKWQAKLGQRDGDYVEIIALKALEAKAAWKAVTGREPIVVKRDAPLSPGDAVSAR